MRRLLEGLPNVSIIEAEVSGLSTRKDRVDGVRLVSGETVAAHYTLLTTGTFIGGVLHSGELRRRGGRYGEPATSGLGEELRSLGVRTRRFKTGTPPRVLRTSVDFSALEEDRGDTNPKPFSWRTKAVRNRVSCWMTRTTSAVREIILENLERSPLFSGKIDGVGPRYCPSIEDKVVRFPHHEEHTLFLEPETASGPSLYVNGFSTSLPRDVQELALRVVPGFSEAEFLRHGYAVEYDVIAPGQVKGTLELVNVPGLFAAGQVLGTSGYEEAAVLGFWAGVNVAARVQGRDPFFVTREEGYSGVLVDDVVNKDHIEPYRILTARAEHRLLLGVDSARERLLEIGERLGLVPERVLREHEESWRIQERARQELQKANVNPDRETRKQLAGHAGLDLHKPTTWARLLTRPGIDVERVSRLAPGLEGLTGDQRDIVISRLRYEGYVERHKKESRRIGKMRDIAIPRNFDPHKIPAFSREVREALEKNRPRTLAEAEKVPGMTPAAMAVLVGYLGSENEQEKHERTTE
jgi:tRNA uridine 5-carboxymethylaminomethyl modification enzyme